MLDPYQIHLNWSDSDSSYSGKSELDEEYYKYKPPPIVISPKDIIVIEAVTKPHESDTEYRKYFPKYAPAENVACKKERNQQNYQTKWEFAGRRSWSKPTNKKTIKSDMVKKQIKNEKYALARTETRNKFDVLASSGDEDAQTTDDVTENIHSGLAENYPNNLEQMVRNSIFQKRSTASVIKAYTSTKPIEINRHTGNLRNATVKKRNLEEIVSNKPKTVSTGNYFAMLASSGDEDDETISCEDEEKISDWVETERHSLDETDKMKTISEATTNGMWETKTNRRKHKSRARMNREKSSAIQSLCLKYSKGKIRK